MKKGLIGKKLGMSQIFADDGRCIPVTVIEAGPCTVVQKKTAENDGYTALQVGFGSKVAHRVNRPLLGHCRVSGKGVFAALRELKLEDADSFSIGDILTVDMFEPGDIVDVTGTSIGKGYQGVVKRWGFKGGRSSHGSRFHRAPGSIGCSATPSRVFKGKKMPGQMGNEKVTIQKLQIVRVDTAENLILIKGSVPGSDNGLVIIKSSVKAR